MAFTIEFDNASELRLPHSTAASGVKDGPWLLSQAMWANTLQFVPDDGAPLEELLGGRWTLNVLVQLADGGRRYHDLDESFDWHCAPGPDQHVAAR